MAAITPKEDEENEEINKDDFMKNKSSMQIKNELEAGKDNPKMKSVIKAMTAEDIFTLFDEDGSGLISFPEFKRMLPYLEIHISDAKAFRYFNICDTDGSGEIDIDEFKVALFTCDPTSGNPVGFKPGKNLTPLDAFEIFDEDGSGFLDEDEFFYAYEYLKIPLTDFKHENYFKTIDINGTGSIDYEEFREVFVRQCNIRDELESRGVDVPSFVRKKTLQNMLRNMLIDEEKRERLAIAEAKRYKKWLLAVRGKKRVIREAKFRAYQELRQALDTAGHVYVFGSGSFNQFSNSAVKDLKTQLFTFENFDKIVELWNDRINPKQLVNRLYIVRKAEEQDEARDANRDLGGISSQMSKKKVTIDPYKEAIDSGFHDLNVQLNTAALWGRRIHHVSIGDSVMFALADTGEIYSMGGNKFWWHEIQPDSLYQTKWRGDTTARSQLLLGTVGKELPPDKTLNRNFDEMTPEEKKCEVIKVVTKYFNVWEPPPNASTRMLYFEKELLPKVEYDIVKFALHARGKHIEESTKYDMMEMLWEDILLEKKLLGERAHKSIRELETQVASLLRRKKDKLAQKILNKIDGMWAPLREVQAEQKAAALAKKVTEEHNKVMKIETDYDNYRNRLLFKREDMRPEYTPRGNSLKIQISGITPRAQELHSPRNFESAIQVSAGAGHACLVHKSGQLYSWGVGGSGRLGLDVSLGGDPQKDTHIPTLVQALSGRPVLRVDCGYSHTAAVVGGGDLYVWGSTAAGKLGLGEIVDKEECFCSLPTKVIVGIENKRVVKVSCGSAHTAVITEQGQLYIFGCGDGGRLGSGKGNYDSIYIPKFVKSLEHERIATVSCGNTTTIVTTEVKREWIGDDGAKFRRLTGGKVYVSGSANVFGKQYDEFTLLEGPIKGKPMKMASAGFQHSVLVSGEGELYTWGHNINQSLGLKSKAHFIPDPTPVTCLYSTAENIGLNKSAYQSSTFNSREASYAVNGKTGGIGLKQCSCTQQDAQSWIEIDLERTALIDTIRLWNRVDGPNDPNQPHDLYTSRLFPCWIMVGQEPFKKDLNPMALKDNLKKAVAKVKFTDNQRISQWKCPINTQARYVRVQLEGYNMLTIAQLEILGFWGLAKGVGRVSYAQAGRDVTVAVIRPSKDPRDIENVYKRAAWSDSFNADILRQYETFALEYDKYGRGEVIQKDCLVCAAGVRCETCTLFEVYDDEIKLMPPAVGGRRRRLNSIDKYLIEANKPPLEIKVVPKKIRPTKWEIRKEKYRSYLKSWFSGKLLPSFVRPMAREDALEIDPEDLMRKINHEKALNDLFLDSPGGDNANTAVVRKHDKDDASVLTESVAESEEKEEKERRDRDEKLLAASTPKMSKAGLKKLRDQAMDGNKEEDDDDAKSAASSIGDEINSKVEVFYHMHKEHYKLKPGDVLPTGHVVRANMPKSLTKAAANAEEVRRLEAERKQKIKESEKRLNNVK